MFFKLSIFKRLLKAALEGQGLTIGHIDAPAIAGTYVKGSWWTVWFSEWHMPKEIKGELISICGELPDTGILRYWRITMKKLSLTKWQAQWQRSITA